MIKKLIIICMTLTLLSCVSNPIDLSKEVDGQDYLAGISSKKYSGAVFDKNKDEEVKTKKEQFEFYPGSGEFINKKAAKHKSQSVSENGEITLNFEGEELTGIVNFMLGVLLQENYVIAPGVTGNVTFATVKPINSDQVMPILEMLLSWNNAALIYIDGRYNVVPKTDAIKGNLNPTFGNIQQRKGYTVTVVPLKYIAPVEMEKLLAPYIKDGAVVKADNARNLLFLSGTRRELSTYIDTINTFDVDWLAGMSTGIFSLNRVEAATIVAELQAIFGEGADNPLAGMFRFMPLERLNAVMVITPQEDYLRKAKEWILRLDRADSESAANLYVYNVKNIKAVDLASYLSDVFTGGNSSSSRKSNSGQVVPGQQAKEIGSSTNKSKNIRRSSSNNDSGLSFTAVEENNQILISANAQEYESIMAAVTRLDKEPLQVLIEAKIIEVSLSDENKFGVQWKFGEATSGNQVPVVVDSPMGPTPGAKRLRGLGGLSRTASSVLGADPSGGTLSYFFTGADVEANLQALDSSGNITVLSTPSIMVLNNKSANINVGDEIPVVTNSFNGFNNGNNGTVGRSTVQFRQTGITLDVKPRINPGGLVYLEVNQEVSVPGDVEPISQNREIATRKIQTEVAIQSGHTVVMGGLIRENSSYSRSGVPLLSRIPIIGNAFGQKSRSKDRTELIVLLTPTVIENPEQARQLTKEYADQFKSLKPMKKGFTQTVVEQYKDFYENKENENEKKGN